MRARARDVTRPVDRTKERWQPAPVSPLAPHRALREDLPRVGEWDRDQVSVQPPADGEQTGQAPTAEPSTPAARSGHFEQPEFDVSTQSTTLAVPRDRLAAAAKRPVVPRKHVADRLMQAEIEAGLLNASRRQVRVGRFVVTRLIGSGAMGSVYEGYDPQLDRRVALKVLAPSPSHNEVSTDRLLREATALARLNHPNVVTVHDAGRAGSEVFLAMEFVAGADLARWCQRNPPGTPQRQRRALDYVCQAARGLAAAHKAGVIHRDFKAANVLVGQDERVRVADFGLAQIVARLTLTFERPAGIGRARGVEATATGLVLGTPVYMAPEQREGHDIDARADQFAFCATAWEVLWGKHPWLGGAPRAEPLAPPPDAEQHLVQALRRGLNLDPAQRFATMDALLHGLETSSSPTARRGLGVAAAIVGAALLGVLLPVSLGWLGGKVAPSPSGVDLSDRAGHDNQSSGDPGPPAPSGRTTAEPTAHKPVPTASEPASPLARNEPTATVLTPSEPAASTQAASSGDPSSQGSGRVVRRTAGPASSAPRPDARVLASVRAKALRKCESINGVQVVRVQFLIEDSGRPALLRSSAPPSDGRSDCVEQVLKSAHFEVATSRRATLDVVFSSARSTG